MTARISSARPGRGNPDVVIFMGSDSDWAVMAATARVLEEFGISHLAGAVAAVTPRPVIGVPLASSPLSGLDSLLSTAQMPSGVPVACAAIGEAGARNAGLLAVEILAIADRRLEGKLLAYRQSLEREVVRKDAALQRERRRVGRAAPRPGR